MTDRRPAFSVIELRSERLPLYRDPGLAPPFPIEALGPLRGAAEAIQDRTQAALATCANSVLAVASLAVCPHVDVRLPFGAIRPTACLFATIAPSGERKSAADDEALRPIREYEEREAKEYKRRQLEFRNRKDTYQRLRSKILARTRLEKSLIELQEQLASLGDEPEEPPYPMLLIEDLTIEGLIKHFKIGRPYAGIFAGEGGLVLGGHAWRLETRMATLAQLNRLWDGGEIRNVRSQTGTLYLTGRRIAAHLMLQPRVAETLHGDPLAEDIGTLARFLLAAPPSLAGTRLYREPSAESARALEAYCDLILSLLQRPVHYATGHRGLRPQAMPLSAEARALWTDFHDRAEQAMQGGREWEAIKPWASKAAEQAARLACVLEFAANPHATEVSRDSIACGIALVEYYGMEALRLVGASSVQPDLRLAQRVLEWWQSRPKDIHATYLYRFGPPGVRDRATALRVMSVLVAHGHAVILPEGTVVDGAPRQHAWRRVDE